MQTVKHKSPINTHTQDSFIIKKKKKGVVDKMFLFDKIWKNYRSDSSAEWEASANLVVAVFKRSSLRSKSSSSSWTRRLRPATSPSAWMIEKREKKKRCIRFH